MGPWDYTLAYKGRKQQNAKGPEFNTITETTKKANRKYFNLKNI